MWPMMAWVAMGVCYFCLSFAANTSFRGFDLAAHDRLVARWAGCRQPSVDVFVPNCGEELAVLENTFKHVAALRWDAPLRVICLDDVGRPELRRLAESHGLEYLSRPNKGEFKKAGNLRYAYKRSKGELIAIFAG